MKYPNSIYSRGSKLYKEILVNRKALENLINQTAGKKEAYYFRSNATQEVIEPTSFEKAISTDNQSILFTGVVPLHKHAAVWYPATLFRAVGGGATLGVSTISQQIDESADVTEMFRQVLETSDALDIKRRRTLEKRQRLASYEDIYEDDL